MTLNRLAIVEDAGSRSLHSMSKLIKQTTICPICRTYNRPDARFCQHCGSNIILDDTYRVVRIIKEGGMGTVYEAIDSAGERYAIKELIDRFVDPQERVEAVQRFLEEARILRDLRHPSIPRVYRSFLHSGRYYLAMDFINGEDLEELLRRNQRFDEETVLRWADQISEVLTYLHGKGVIYRDMKPSNVMIEHGTGAVKLVDFGIAKLFQPAQRGTLIGTPGYAPPEQYQGLATPQSDIYALGATLHHLLTGRDPRDEAPFSFPPVRTLAPHISPETAAAIERALQMDPNTRWPDAAALRAALPLDRHARRRPSTTTMLPPPAAPVRRAVPEPAVAMPRVGAKPAPQAAQLPPRRHPLPTRPPAPVKPVPVKPKSQGLSLKGLLMALLLILGLIYIAEPGVQQWVNESIEQLITPPPPEQPAHLSHQLELDVEIIVPAGSSEEEIDRAFRRAFEEAAKEQLGPQAFVNPNVPLAYIGPIVKLGDEVDGKVRYTARMSGRVWGPVR